MAKLRYKDEFGVWHEIVGGGGAEIDDSHVSVTKVWSSSKVSSELAEKQSTLVSGTSIKTVNNQSLMGSGNIVISGDGGITAESEGTEVTPTEAELAADPALQNIIDSYKAMIEDCDGDFNKIPLIIMTDLHSNYCNVGGASISPKWQKRINYINQMVNWTQISKLINLGDTVNSAFGDQLNAYLWGATGELNLQQYKKLMDVIPAKKRIEIAGNHDTYADKDSRETPMEDQAPLTKYLKNIYARRENEFHSFTVIDDYYNVKYICANDLNPNEGGSATYISGAEMEWLIDELSEDDGYDIIWCSHHPHKATGGEVFGRTLGVLNMLTARKNKTSGTIDDSDGLSHSYDFAGCRTEFLCSLGGHYHNEYGFLSTASENQQTWGTPIPLAMTFYNAVLYFAYVDRKAGVMKVWRTTDAGTSQAARPADEPLTFPLFASTYCKVDELVMDDAELTIGETRLIVPHFNSDFGDGLAEMQTCKTDEWSSDNPNVTVDGKGYVTVQAAAEVGETATITAVSTQNSVTGTCTVTVVAQEADDG